MSVPKGFKYAGMRAGIKAARSDFALVAADVPCAAAGCFTINASRAAPVRDAAARLPAEGIRAVVTNSGNANALTGPNGIVHVRQVAAAVAQELGVPAESVLCASTGVIGVPLPVHKLIDAAPRLVAARREELELAAEAI
jgi:acetylglutamate kinase